MYSDVYIMIALYQGISNVKSNNRKQQQPLTEYHLNTSGPK